MFNQHTGRKSYCFYIIRFNPTILDSILGCPGGVPLFCGETLSTSFDAMHVRIFLRFAADYLKNEWLLLLSNHIWHDKIVATILQQNIRHNKTEVNLSLGTALV